MDRIWQRGVSVRIRIIRISYYSNISDSHICVCLHIMQWVLDTVVIMCGTKERTSIVLTKHTLKQQNALVYLKVCELEKTL